jgi:hypothetical protein
VGLLLFQIATEHPKGSSSVGISYKLKFNKYVKYHSVQVAISRHVSVRHGYPWV